MRITAALMLKAPRPGWVKTRLAATVGDEKAAAVYRQLAEGQIAEVPPEWRVAVYYAPAGAEEEMRVWLGSKLPKEARFVAQTEGDLGARMRAAVVRELEAGAEGVVLLGGDCAELGREDLRAAGRMLGEADVVIGPAEDGGYVFLAVKRDWGRLFEEMPWSTPQVLEMTLRRAGELGLRVVRTRSYRDVDDAESYGRRSSGGIPS